MFLTGFSVDSIQSRKELGNLKIDKQKSKCKDREKRLEKEKEKEKTVQGIQECGTISNSLPYS